MDENRELMNPDQPEGMMFHQMEGLPMGVPIEVLQSGRGFALKDNESHVLRLNVWRLSRPMDPTQIRTLLASNKSLDEIRKEIQAREDVDHLSWKLDAGQKHIPSGQHRDDPSGQ